MSLSLCHCHYVIPLSLCHYAIAIMSLSDHVIMPVCHYATMSLCHCHYAIMSCHYVIVVSLCLVIMALFHCRYATVSLSVLEKKKLSLAKMCVTSFPAKPFDAGRWPLWYWCMHAEVYHTLTALLVDHCECFGLELNLFFITINNISTFTVCQFVIMPSCHDVTPLSHYVIILFCSNKNEIISLLNLFT